MEGDLSQQLLDDAASLIEAGGGASELPTLTVVSKHSVGQINSFNAGLRMALSHAFVDFSGIAIVSFTGRTSLGSAGDVVGLGGGILCAFGSNLPTWRGHAVIEIGQTVYMYAGVTGAIYMTFERL
jgi:hypothetical protein